MGQVDAGISTETGPFAREIAALIQPVRQADNRVLLVETISNPCSAGQLARERGVTVGAALIAVLLPLCWATRAG